MEAEEALVDGRESAAILVTPAHRSERADVGARAERGRRARHDEATDPVVVLEPVDTVHDLLNEVHRERVAAIRVVEREHGDALAPLEMEWQRATCGLARPPASAGRTSPRRARSGTPGRPSRSPAGAGGCGRRRRPCRPSCTCNGTPSA